MAQTKKNGVPVHFHFHGCLVELLARTRRGDGYTVSLARRTSIKDAVESQGVPHVEVGLLALNGIPTDWKILLAEEGRIDAWSVTDATSLPRTLRVDTPDPVPIRFLLDVHLGRLASYLRLIGMDTEYESQDPGDERLAQRASSESRILLSCDRGLLMRNIVLHGHLLRSRNSIEQAREVVDRYHLRDLAAPFTRCLACNSSLRAVEIDAIRDRIPPRVHRRLGNNPDRYRICPGCGKLYWEGTHTARMRRLLAEWGIEG